MLFLVVIVLITALTLGFALVKAAIKQKSAEKKGAKGEALVASQIGHTLEGVQYVINDFMFNVGQKSCQIDHIVINRNGVFVIETKNYSGRIYGSDNDKYWTQKLASQTNRLYSPVKQNASHVYNLSRVLSSHIFLVSLVVFVQNNTENVRSENVIGLRVLRQRLTLPSKIKPYTPSQMREIYEEILSVQNKDITNKEHVANIKRAKANIDALICPYCNRPLVKRQGKYGTFFGCSSYPECKFIKNTGE
jgi:hypothetical protein